MHVPLNKPKAKDRETGNSTQEQEKRWDLICEYLCVIILNENDKKSRRRRISSSIDTRELTE